MSNIYLVMFCDGYYDSSDHPVAIYRDKEKAIDYAVNYDLAHDELVTVEERQEGVQDCRQVVTIYQRQHYDHTQALFYMVGCAYFMGRVGELTEQEIVDISVREASPLITEDVDFSTLYQLYKEECGYDED